jgi:AraC-like DNA-binding protein
MVGLLAERRTGRDPVEQAVARDALQRKSATIAQELGNVVSGRVGEHGIVLLSAGSGPARRCAERAARAAQQLGFSLCFGLCAATESDPLGRSYRSALSAAEVALVRGSKTVTGGAPRSLGELRRELGRVLDHDPRTLAGKFEPYLGAVAARCGHRVDPARGHLEAGFERLAEPLLASGALDDKSFSELFETLSRSADAAPTLGDLLAVYRRAVVDLSEAVREPGATGQERGLRRALDHMHAHFTERLRLSSVARLAGISPDYFSRLLKKRERMTFERYLRGLRIERAQQLLIDTGVNIDRVARLSGFASAAYFCRVFHNETGMTPGVFRRRNATTSRDIVRKSARLVRHPAS